MMSVDEALKISDWAGASNTEKSLAAEVRRIREENERLREWIMQSGNNNNECVRSVIGKVCDGCMCGAKK